MKNCIFICLFNQKQYEDMFFLLLESIFIYGNLDNDTDILLYTTTEFMNRIIESHLFDGEKIKFEINDTYNDSDNASVMRLDIFDLQCITNYNKILYLDTDILVKDDINKVFNVCNEDIIYALEEGVIWDSSENEGNRLFEDTIDDYADKSAFTTGILLFNNCDTIKVLFDNIKEDMATRQYPNVLFDEPYIVYNAFKYNLYNNKVLKSFAVNSDNNIHTDKVLHQFSGESVDFKYKIQRMVNFLCKLKEYTISINTLRTKAYIDEYLLPIIQSCGERLEGNIFMAHLTNTYSNIFENKVKNISNVVLNKNVKNVMEIGFNAGFSTLLMLISNPNIKITCYDLGEHVYTIPCFTKLKEIFGERINLIIGDSMETLQHDREVYDLIHIDGGHSQEVANNDITHSYRLSKNGTILIMDDYDFIGLHALWDESIVKYELRPLQINIFPCIFHDIKYVYNK